MTSQRTRKPRKSHPKWPDLWTLSDEELLQLHSDVTRESRRRASVFACGVDGGAAIKGHEHVKRALVVAAVRHRSVMLIGPQGCGKTSLRTLAAELGCGPTIELWPCPCGNLTDPRLTCPCTALQIEHHLRKYRRAAYASDITVRVYPVPVSMLQDKRHGTTSAEMLRRVREARELSTPKWCPDDMTQRMERQAVTELGLSTGAVTLVRDIACDIAALAGEPVASVAHYSEAVQYRRTF